MGQSAVDGFHMTRKETPDRQAKADIPAPQAQAFQETHGRARTALRPVNPWVFA